MSTLLSDDLRTTARELVKRRITVDLGRDNGLAQVRDKQLQGWCPFCGKDEPCGCLTLVPRNDWHNFIHASGTRLLPGKVIEVLEEVSQ